MTQSTQHVCNLCAQKFEYDGSNGLCSECTEIVEGVSALCPVATIRLLERMYYLNQSKPHRHVPARCPKCYGPVRRHFDQILGEEVFQCEMDGVTCSYVSPVTKAEVLSVQTAT